MHTCAHIHCIYMYIYVQCIYRVFLESLCTLYLVYVCMYRAALLERMPALSRDTSNTTPDADTSDNNPVANEGTNSATPQLTLEVT